MTVMPAWAEREGIEGLSPGIPGGDNRWYPSQGQARAAALRLATAYGPGFRIAHDPRPQRGQPHYHVVDPAGRRVSGHLFYGRRLPYKVPRFLRGPARRRQRRLRESEADAFSIHVPLLAKEGHERLTRLAAAGLPGVGPGDLRALVSGVRRVDTGLPTKHFAPSEQRRHVLRRSLCQPLAAALAEARDHLVSLHTRAMATSTRAEFFGWLGEALHLLQDSYSEAHTQRSRASGLHPITYIRFYGLRGRGFPQEHRVPSDPRDQILDASGRLTPAARQAASASREFLRMALRHRRMPAASRSAELRRFMNRHLILSASRTEPSSLYRCRP